MSRAATSLALGITMTLAAYGCGSSSSGGTGGATGTGGTTGTGGGTSHGGTTGTGGGSSNGGATGTGGTTGPGGSTGTDGGNDSSLATCGDRTDPSQGESCNTIVPAGPCVVETLSSATTPTPAGGTVIPGTYELMSMTIYGAPDSGLDSDRRGTIMISAGSGANMFNVQVAEQGGTSLQRQSGMAIADSAQKQITFTPSCPNGDSGGSSPYSATATTFTLFEDHNGGTRVNVYLKR